MHTCMAEHTDEKDIKCEELDESFNSDYDVTQHVTVDEKDIKCEELDESFDSNYDVTQHVTVDEINIKCLKSVKSYDKKEQQKQHMAVHSGDEEDFKCEECGYDDDDGTTYDDIEVLGDLLVEELPQDLEGFDAEVRGVEEGAVTSPPCLRTHQPAPSSISLTPSR
ncbi:Zinc finger protein 714-like, partial [Homarus americanus]